MPALLDMFIKKSFYYRMYFTVYSTVSKHKLQKELN